MYIIKKLKLIKMTKAQKLLFENIKIKLIKNINEYNNSI